MPLSKDKRKEILSILAKFRKDHEIDDVAKIGFMSDDESIGKIEHLKTGNIGLDTITNGGLIKGKVNIFYGAENCGKSTLAIDIIAYQQKQDPEFVAGLCDNEKVFDREYAISRGVDPDRLIVGAGFTNAEQAYDFCNDFCSSGAVNLLVVDTIQALAAKGEIVTKKGKKKSTEDDTMALIPRLLSQFLRMYTSQTDGNVTLLLLSQVRLDLGSFMPSAKKTGGKAIDHYNVLTLKLASARPWGSVSAGVPAWPYTVTEPTAPAKSFALKMRLDKAKMQGRYDGNTLVMYFKEGQFEHRFNILAIAKDLELFDGKSFSYVVPGSDTIVDVKYRGFKEMYEKIDTDALNYLETRISEAYTKLISYKTEEVEDEPETSVSESE